MQQIKRHDYQLFLNTFGDDKSRETVEKLYLHIRGCVQNAIEEQIIHHDFTRKAVLTWNTPSKKPHEKHLDYIESRRLLKAVFNFSDQELGYYLILLGLTSRARFGELVGLTKIELRL
jgi:integrase